MTARLPNRRQTETVRFEHGRARYYGSWSCYGDVRPAEVFLDAGKVGSDLQAMARDAAIVTSLALRSGVALETMRQSITRLEDGSAAGPLGKMLDMIAEAA